MFNNVLRNPELKGFTVAATFKDAKSNTHIVENPPEWEMISYPQNPDDPNELPNSFHRDFGFIINAPMFVWEGGYLQRNVQLRKGQRYLCKAAFTPDLRFVRETRPDDWRSVLEWQFV